MPTIGYGLEPYGAIPYGDEVPTPDVRVEIDFTGTTWDSAADPVWTDVSEYVQELNPSRGRGNEIGSVEAGTASLTLDNSDGRFTPALSTSPYFPYVKPRRPIRAYAVYQGTEYPLFRGVTGRFPATTAAGSTSVTISCVDITTPLSKKPLENPYVHTMTGVSPTGHDFGATLVELFKMDDGPTRFAGVTDPVGNYMIPQAAATNGGIATAGGGEPTVEANGESILPNTAGLGSAGVSGIAQEAVASLNGSGTNVQTSSGIAFVSTPFPLAPAADGGDFTISLYHRLNEAQPGQDGAFQYALVFQLIDANTGVPFIQVVTETESNFFGYYPNKAKGRAFNYRSYFTNSRAVPHIGQSNLVQVKYKSGATPQIALSIDGYDTWTNIEGTDFFKAGDYKIVIGSLLGYNSGAIGPTSLVGSNFSVEMVSIHNEVIDAYNTAGQMLAAAGYDNQPPSERINYLLDQLGCPDSLRNIDTTDDGSRILFINWEGTPETLSELRAPALDANGLLFVGPDGKVTYQSRRQRVNPVAKWVFDEDAGTGAEGPLSWDMSEDDITNVAAIDNAYGIKATLRNEASIGEFGETSVSLDTRLVNDEEAIQAGYWRINRFGDAQLRLDGVTVNPSAHASGALWITVLSLELSDCIGLRNLPDTAPDQVIDYFVERITHNIARNGEALTWTTDLQVSPATNREGWILGDPELSRLGHTTILHY